MPIAPTPGFPEKPTYIYERKMAPNLPGGRGPLRFQEGVATDTDIPSDFQMGMMQGYGSAPGRPNHNQKVDTKYPEETMAQRAHVGSAAWIESPTFLSEFARGSFSDYATIEFESVTRTGQRMMRLSPSVVDD